MVLDEYNELKEAYGGIETDSMMQKIIDNLSGTDVRVIISGSAVSVMMELLDSSNPLFDRFFVALKLEDFDYFESSAFLGSWPSTWQRSSFGREHFAKRIYEDWVGS